MTANARVHVIVRDDYWAIKKEGSSRASKKYQTKQKAVNAAKKLSKSGHDVVVHKRDGSVEKIIEAE